MEISSKTIISWFFHLHGNVRAKASKISCACSVTFSPMLSVCIVIIKERERERERCQWIQHVAVVIHREKDVPERNAEHTHKQLSPFWDDARCALVQDHAERNTRNARRRQQQQQERTRDKLRRFHRGFKPSLLPSLYRCLATLLALLPLCDCSAAERRS